MPNTTAKKRETKPPKKAKPRTKAKPPKKAKRSKRAAKAKPSKKARPGRATRIPTVVATCDALQRLATQLKLHAANLMSQRAAIAEIPDPPDDIKQAAAHLATAAMKIEILADAINAQAMTITGWLT